MSAIILHHQKVLEQALLSKPNLLPAAPLARQGNPLNPNDATPYYLDCFSAWFHNHATGASGLLVQVKSNVLKCEHCHEAWDTPPPPMKWSMNREHRVPEVMTRIQPTADPWVWRCPERTCGDGRIYRIEFDQAVNRWTCTCRDWRDFQHRFWACKHVRAVLRKIRQFIADRGGEEASGRGSEGAREEANPSRGSFSPNTQETPNTPSPLPVGRPIKGNGWRGTLLTRKKDGVAYLEVCGVIHTAPHQQIWAEISKRGFEVADDGVWLDIAHEMGEEGEK